MSSAVVSVPPPPTMGVTKGSSATHSQGAVENFTVTCYTCGMPSSKEWAQRVHSRPQTPTRPFYPFLADIKSPPAGAFLCRNDGTTFLCAFCQASLDAQWKAFEKAAIILKDRQYNLNSFVCAVCGVETYRKRVRALPFQEFPFLTKERPRGSLTLGKNPLAVVCLDCSETLWAQSAEYDRWGLPIHKRHFNWMTRPPPPENSMEATVARLPSGETQLPRCPPTEPVVGPRRKEPFNTATIPKPVSEFRVRTTTSTSQSQIPYQSTYRSMRPVPPTLVSTSDSFGKRVSVVERPIMTNEQPPNIGRSLSSTHNHPDPHILHLPQGTTGVPVVTVAPLASHVTTTTTNSTKQFNESNKAPIALSNLDSLRHVQKPPEMNHQPTLMSSTNLPYGTFNHWAGSGHLEHFPYATQLGIDPSNASSHGAPNNGNGQLSWNVPPAIINPDYARYQSYLAVTGNSYKNAVESYFSQPRPHPLLQSTEASVNSSNARVPHNNWNRSSSNTSSHHVAQLLTAKKGQGQVTSSQLQLPNKTTAVDASRKRQAIPEQGASLPKVPHLMNNHTGPGKSDFISNARVTRHFNQSGVEPNRDYILSVSAIVNESEMARPRGGKNDYNIPSPQIRRKVIEDANGAMDLSLMRALKVAPGTNASGTEILGAAIPSRYSVGAPPPPVPQQEKNNTSGFLIANLCSENMSPPQRMHTHKHIPTQYSKDLCEEDGNRDSVIVNLRSPSICSPSSTKSPAPVSSTTDNTEESRKNKQCMDVAAAAVQKETTEKLSEEQLNNEASPVSTSLAETTKIPTRGGGSDYDKSAGSTTEIMSNGDITGVNGDVQSDANASICITKHIQHNGEYNGHDNISNSVATTQPETDRQLTDMEIIEKSVTDFKLEKARRIAREHEEAAIKEQFLKTLQLVAPNKRNAMELKLLLRRYNKRVLPPIKLRPQDPQEESSSISEQVEKRILLTAFEDASLKKPANNPKLLSFMTNLNMKPASKAEKYRREENWRVQLAERILRLKRGRPVSGDKKPWDMIGNISKHLLDYAPARKRRHSLPPISERKPRQMRSLSITLPISPPRFAGIESSDLLATVTCTNGIDKGKDQMRQEAASAGVSNAVDPQNLQKIISVAPLGRNPVITYPKYIPSYASSLPGTSSQVEIPSSLQNSKLPALAETIAKEMSSTPTTLSVALVTEDSSPMEQSKNGVAQVPCPLSEIDEDELIKSNTKLWEHMKKEIDRLVEAKCEKGADVPFYFLKLNKIRKHLISQISDMKLMVHWLKNQDHYKPAD